MARDKRVQLRSAAAWPKALVQYDELRAGQKLRQALVIAEDHTGDVTVLAQGMMPARIPPLLALAAAAISRSMDNRAAPQREAHRPPVAPGEKVGITMPENQRGITTNAEGILVAPAGEAVISCGECFHPRFHVTMADPPDNGPPRRLACAACGNEIVMRQVFHAEGRA